MKIHIHKFLLLACLALLPLSGLPAPGDIEVIVVTGRRPGPPLWRVSNGDHTLWILPLVSNVPKDMEWDDTRVAGLIANADEVIDQPNVTFSVPKGVLLNPLNAVRALRLWNRVRENADGAQLADVLPADLYQRYAALKNAYFPQDRVIDSLRPSAAAEEMFKHVLDEEKLTDTRVIERQVERHIRRNRDLVRTEMSLVHTLEGSYGELSERAEILMGSVPREHEAACFDLQLAVLERHLDDIKAIANAWANGSAAELEDYLDADNFANPCAAMMVDSTEGELMVNMQIASRARWLDAAQAALEKNPSTFAMLPLARIIGDASLVTELGARGYVIHDPR
jgi:hypothetical protein